MALSGNITGTTSNAEIQSIIVWEAVQSKENNSSTVTASLYYAKGDSEQTTYGTWSGSITIGGVTEVFSGIRLSLSPNSGNILTASFTAEIPHDANGFKIIDISATGAINGTSLSQTTIRKSVHLNTIPQFVLNVSTTAGIRSIVYRVSSDFGTIGLLSNNDPLYYRDTLKISYELSQYYKLKYHIVNGSPFTSGNTYYVTSSVTIAASANIVSSSVCATDADIETNSTIVVSKVNDDYVHSLKFCFGDLSGYIASDGSIVPDEVKYGETTVLFPIPADFYAQIPNSTSGECSIICCTYENVESDAVLGAETECSFTTTATYERCAPTLDVSIIDINENARALSGAENTFIRHASKILCTATAQAANSALISSIVINNLQLSPSIGEDGTYIGRRQFNQFTASKFEIIAIDSRGYKVETTITPKIYEYIPLTCNPVLSRRPTESGGEILMTATGNIYSGYFGDKPNQLTIKYRYREHGGSYGDWHTIDMNNVIIETSSYRIEEAVSLGEDFDHQKPYEFEIQALDGIDECPLSVVVITATAKRGIPIFDWGEDDFNINGTLKINNESIFDIVYPVGTVFLYTQDSIPDIFSNIDSWEWEVHDIGITGVYAWRRVT